LEPREGPREGSRVARQRVGQREGPREGSRLETREGPTVERDHEWDQERTEGTKKEHSRRSM
jgi:hypothetical protein